MRHIAVLMLSLAGFALLLLSVSRHQQDWLRRKLGRPARHGVRATGFVLLALALTTAGLTQGWGYGTVAWLGWLTIAAGLMVATHSSRDRTLARLRR